MLSGSSWDCIILIWKKKGCVKIFSVKIFVWVVLLLCSSYFNLFIIIWNGHCWGSISVSKLLSLGLLVPTSCYQNGQLQYLSAIGCRACEASLSNILCSGGCRGWSSSLRAWLQRCNSRWWRQASHNTCWFLSLFTRSCRMLATASCRSRACWEEKKVGELDVKTKTKT